MISSSDIVKFFEGEDERRRELAEYRMMVQRAHSLLSKIDREDKSVPVWLQNYLIRLRETLTMEPRN